MMLLRALQNFWFTITTFSIFGSMFMFFLLILWLRIVLFAIERALTADRQSKDKEPPSSERTASPPVGHFKKEHMSSLAAGNRPFWLLDPYGVESRSGSSTPAG